MVTVRSTAIVAALGLLIGTIAQAQTTTYDYTGATMSGTEYGDIGPDFDYETVPASGSFDATMTLTSALAPNLNDAIVDPLDLTISVAGITMGGSVNSIDPEEFGNPVNGVTLLLTEGETVSTNSKGQITTADMIVYNGAGAGAGAFPAIFVGSSSITPTGDTLAYDDGNHGPDYSMSNDVAGTWTEVSSGAQAAPEINAAGAVGALTLLAGLLAIGRAQRRSMG